MVNINKQIEFWVQGAKEDFEVAHELIASKRTRHGLFFIHLALEKMIKANICKNTGDIAPRIHNLIRLSEIASLSPEKRFSDILAELNAFNLEGRYPDPNITPVSMEEASGYLKRAEKAYQWLMNLLK